MKVEVEKFSSEKILWRSTLWHNITEGKLRSCEVHVNIVADFRQLRAASSVLNRTKDLGLGRFFFNNKNGILAASSAQRQSYQQVKRKSELFSKWKNYTQKRRGCFTIFRDELDLSWCTHRLWKSNLLLPAFGCHRCVLARKALNSTVY